MNTVCQRAKKKTKNKDVSNKWMTKMPEQTIGFHELTTSGSEVLPQIPLKKRIKRLIRSGFKGYLAQKKNIKKKKSSKKAQNSCKGHKKVKPSPSLEHKKPLESMLHKQSEISNLAQFENINENKSPVKQKDHNSSLKNYITPRFIKDIETIQVYLRTNTSELKRQTSSTEEEDVQLPTCISNLSAFKTTM
ncbi:unnamed protein product [Moneuplotes crassus]|uniref:Uncharacterized protein n=1 Tax=Euplotes crassus TaxID=5936 RepID=A0AAD1X8U5_EUPCR|nr:unnamed protein product [Moneuplotes crassus]